VLDTQGGRGRGQWRQRTQRKAGSRSTAATRSKGGRVEVDGGSATMTKSLRKRMAAARSEVGVEAETCSGDGEEVATCSGARIMDGRWQWWFLGRQQSEREHEVKILLCVERKSAGLKF
jgi:hypothetical protein